MERKKVNGIMVKALKRTEPNASTMALALVGRVPTVAANRRRTGAVVMAFATPKVNVFAKKGSPLAHVV
jgi:hypothetical protein